MTRIFGTAILALGLLACETPSPSGPSTPGSTRLTNVSKIPEGTEVLVALITSGVPAGTTFVVQGAGNNQGATCTTSISTSLYLHEITMVGGGADVEGWRSINYTFSEPMPKGTQFRIVAPVSPTVLCGGGNYVYRAVVTNGSGAG